jgi:AcrR family transcriptional regulator
VLPTSVPPTSVPDRRAQRRADTIDEILDIAVDLMAVDGVGGLTVSAVARRLGVKPPSIYKYFPSLIAIYDTLFRRGQEANLRVLRTAMDSTAGGLPAIEAGLEATGRWAVEHPVIAQLLFWRPVPGYVPTADAFAPTLEIVASLRRELQKACDLGDLGAGAASDDALTLLSTLHFGMISQQLANDPDGDWANGRFTRLLPTLLELFVSAYPPTGKT